VCYALAQLYVVFSLLGCTGALLSARDEGQLGEGPLTILTLQYCCLCCRCLCGWAFVVNEFYAIVF
jgi:hypothetical protein